jgi:hypothetical protein
MLGIPSSSRESQKTTLHKADKIATSSKTFSKYPPNNRSKMPLSTSTSSLDTSNCSSISSWLLGLRHWIWISTTVYHYSKSATISKRQLWMRVFGKFFADKSVSPQNTTSSSPGRFSNWRPSVEMISSAEKLYSRSNSSIHSTRSALSNSDFTRIFRSDMSPPFLQATTDGKSGMGANRHIHKSPGKRWHLGFST